MTEVDGSLGQGDGALAVLGDGSNIVIESGERKLPKVKKACGHVSLSKNAGLLQVTTCQVTCGIGGGDDVVLDVLRKAGSPHGQRFSQG